jgi:hypothetical protein
MTNKTLAKKLQNKNIKTRRLLPRLAKTSMSEAKLTKRGLFFDGFIKRGPTLYIGASG